MLLHIFLWPPCIADADIIFWSCFFFFLAWSQRSQTECLPYFYTWCGPSANLECRSEMFYTRLAWNAGSKKSLKTRHLGTTTQLCRALSSQIRHVSTLGKNLPRMSSQYGELRPTDGWDPFGSLGHPSKFLPVSRLGSVTARHSSSGRPANFMALNRGRDLYSAGRPSRWAMAHILDV